MMTEPKPFASLSSSLLARKGQAKPAMRPQGYANFTMPVAQHEDLGWNDMGHDHGAPQPVAEVVPIQSAAPSAPPAVVRQQEELVREFTPMPEAVVAAPPAPRKARAAAGSKGKAAFTLRLDPERHLKLRLVCAVEHRSAQAIVVAALDAFLAEQPAARLANATPTA